MNQIDEQSADIIWPIIFQNLSIKDLFNCRLVNKQFKFYAEKSVHKLLAYDYDNFFIFDKKLWFHNNQVIDDDYSISQKCFQTIRKLSIFKLNNSLKYLTIKFDFKKYKKGLLGLNDLINLESLEFFFSHLESVKKKKIYKLNLKNLKCLKIGSEYENIHYKLNTPKLEKIELFRIGIIQFESNPKSIKHLITQEYEDKIKIFKNLEIIEFILNNGTNLNIDINLLSFFKNLKQLRFEINYEFCGLNEILEEKIAQILNKRKKLNRNIDIHLFGIKLMDIDKLKEIRSDDRNITDYLFNNYDLLDFTKLNHLYQYYLFDYYDMIDLRNDIPSSFFDKFLYIITINLSCIVTEDNDLINSFMDNMNWLLNNLKCLVNIEMGSGFTQNFFDNLPISIRRLLINDEESSYSNINFNFIFKLKKLIEFIIHCDVDLFDTTLAFISNSTNPVNFFFKFRDKIIESWKIKNYFILECKHSNDHMRIIHFEFSNYNKFVDKFKNIESKLKNEQNFIIDRYVRKVRSDLTFRYYFLKKLNDIKPKFLSK